MDVVGLAGTAFGVSSTIAKANQTKRWRMEQLPAELRKPRLGLLTLHEPPQPSLDIVFVHGLQGDAARTWMNTEVFWPKDLLPQDCPNARILTFGYAALVLGETPPLIKDLGQTLLNTLAINRRNKKATTRPLIFMAHSLGGIIVKSALVYSRALNVVDKDYLQISNATCACVFFGTPHIRSGKASWVQIKSQISRALAAHSLSLTRNHKSMLESEEAEDMLRLSSDFCYESGRIKLISCFETRTTPTDRGRLLVVPKENAQMKMPNEVVIAIDADHIEMTKIANRLDPVYCLILNLIRDTTSEIGNLRQLAAPKITTGRQAGTEIPEGLHDTHEEYCTGFEERKRRFLSNLRSDWLDDVMIEDNSPGTCEWILSSQAFQTWLSRSEKILWIQGRAGTGKTVLAKFLYRQLCGVFAGNGDTSGNNRPQWISSASNDFSRPRQVLAYFLNYSSPLRNSGLSVLQSLLYQILSTDQELFRHAHGKSVFSRPEGGDFGHYAELLNAILRDPSSRGTIIVLDALDECEPTSREKIIDMLSNLAIQSSIQLLVTSRPDTSFKPGLMLDLSESVEHFKVDIKLFVETAVQKLVVAQFSEELRSVITKTLLAHSSENFLWVQLVLQSISKVRTVRMVRKRLEHLPKDLHNAYLDLLSGSTESTDVNVRRTLYFVVVARAPLQVKDLSALLALSHCWDFPEFDTEEKFRKRPISTDTRVTPNLREITESQTMNFDREFRHHFQGLLRLNETSVSLVHYSLRDFLTIPREIDKFHATFNSHPLGNKDGNGLGQVHGTMAVLCLQYMLAAFQGHSDPLNFLTFACFHWAEHARRADKSQNIHLAPLVKLLFLKKDFISSWLSIVANSETAQVELLPLNAGIAFVLTAFDLGSHFGEMLDVSVESLRSIDQKGRTPLHFAAANNSLMSIQWIRNVFSAGGQDLGDLATQKDHQGESPISLAAQNGHERLMELLLLSMNSKHTFDPRLFKIIADSGSVGMFVTLYENTTIKSIDQGMSLLIGAAALNRVDLMKKILIDYGGPEYDQARLADLGILRSFPLLHIALRKKATEVIEYLLDCEYPLSIMDKNEDTALHVAAREGNEQVVAKFMDAGVSANCFNKDGETPLHIASKIGLPAIVRTLCFGGAEVNLTGSSGRLPVHLAAGTGQEEIIYILLQFGTNINAVDGTGCSALHLAAGAGQAPIVSALLMHGADVRAFDDEGKSTVHYAVESGNLSVLYMLCEAGADLSAFDYSQKTPLHLAAQYVSAVLVRELLGLQTDPNVRDSDGRTPLHYGCLSERSTVAVIRTLLENGADVRACDVQGISPMHLAAEQGLDAIVRELTLFGGDLHCKDSDGQTPLDYAMRNSNVAVIEVLRELGAANSVENELSSFADPRRRALESIGFGSLEGTRRGSASNMLS